MHKTELSHQLLKQMEALIVFGKHPLTFLRLSLEGRNVELLEETQEGAAPK